MLYIEFVKNIEELNQELKKIKDEYPINEVFDEHPNSYPCMLIVEVREYEYSDADMIVDYVYKTDFE